MNFKSFAAYLLVCSQIPSAFAYKLDKSGVLLTNDGKVASMEWHDALTACPVGTHLPSAREMAELAVKSGAKGILEQNSTAPGYTAIRTVDLEKRAKDQFFYDFTGYSSQNSLFEANSFWSSSVGTNTGHIETGKPWSQSSIGAKKILTLSGSEGRIFTAHDDTELMAMVCLPGAAPVEKRPVATTKCGDLDAYFDRDGIMRVLYPSVSIGDGAYCRLNTKKEILSACPAGTHLPSVREASLRASTLGYASIVEARGAKPAGWDLISAEQANGAIDQFFRAPTSAGYEPEPTLKLNDNMFWTSSANANVDENLFSYSERSGQLETMRLAPGAQHLVNVRCFRD